MKFLIGQINTTPCDFIGNCDQIIYGISRAAEEGCKLVIFPELSIPGYLSQDLIYNEGFIEKNHECVRVITEISKNHPDLRIVVGCIDRNTKGIGKPFWNMAIMIHNGYVAGRYKKQLLPFYDVFDEGRYFEPGKDTTVFKIDDTTFGLTICEDIWNDKEQEEHKYISDPVEEYQRLGIDCLINISSSPYCKHKPFKRQQVIDSVAKKFKKGAIYVNQVGGQDELIFDGCSTYVQFDGHKGLHYRYTIDDKLDVTYKKMELSPSLYYVSSRDWLRHSMNYVRNVLVLGLRDYLKKSGFNSVVIGSSGGIDSAVTSCLAAEAIGPENVHCIMMPSVFSSDHSLTDAKELHKKIGCHEYKIPIDHIPVIENLKSNLNIEGDYSPLADENIQPRIRGSYLMWFSNACGHLLLTTGNKTELAIGYATLYGDMCGGYAPICDLYKMEVYQLAKEVYAHWIPENIIEKEPSAELAEDQFDANELLPYPILDKIVEEYIENNIHTFNAFKEKVGCEDDVEEDYNKIIRRIDVNEFKRRQYAPGTKISCKSFGIGRRIPIVKGKK